MNCQIIRLEKTNLSPTPGVFIANGIPLIATLELPWRDNMQKVSCIPEGTYECRKVFDRTLSSGGFLPVTFEVINVSNRSGILFHAGNAASNSQGCILTGSSLTSVHGELWLTEARKAYQKFLQFFMDVDAFTLEV